MSEQMVTQWVIDHNGMVGWSDCGTVFVELRGVNGMGASVAEALDNWWANVLQIRQRVLI